MGPVIGGPGEVAVPRHAPHRVAVAIGDIEPWRARRQRGIGDAAQHLGHLPGIGHGRKGQRDQGNGKETWQHPHARTLASARPA
jgi:hypothetical protein